MKVYWFVALLVMAGCEVKDRIIDVFFASETTAIEEQCQPDPNDQGEQIEVCKQLPTGVVPTSTDSPTSSPTPSTSQT